MDAANKHGGQEQAESDAAKNTNKSALPKKSLVCAFILTGLAIVGYYVMKKNWTPEVIMPKSAEKEAILWKIFHWLKTLF